MAACNRTGSIVILGTGGTIAGRSTSAGDNVGYRAGSVPVSELVGSVPSLQGLDIEHEQVAQLDSKDMVFSVWQRLLHRLRHHLARPEVDGVVITHGTDTLEETAWFLHCLLSTEKPVVFACAMRPASSLTPDGPQNLADAVAVARDPRMRGVLAVCAGLVHSAEHIAKTHPYRTDAFDSGEAGPLGAVEEGKVRLFWSPQQAGVFHCLQERVLTADALPRVEVIISHADADGEIVRALLHRAYTDDRPLRGIVVAGTGNGTVHERMEAALQEASAGGVVVWRASRCAGGIVVAGGRSAWPAAASSPPKARITLALELLATT